MQSIPLKDWGSVYRARSDRLEFWDTSLSTLVVFFIAVLAMSMILGANPADGDQHREDVNSFSTQNEALLTAFGSVLATIGNIGPGLGGVGPMENYGQIPDVGKALLVFLMLLGRLEIYAVAVILVPLTWRR